MSLFHITWLDNFWTDLVPWNLGDISMFISDKVSSIIYYVNFSLNILNSHINCHLAIYEEIKMYVNV